MAGSRRNVIIVLCPQATAKCDPHALGCNATRLSHSKEPPSLHDSTVWPRGIGLAALGAVLAGFECSELVEVSVPNSSPARLLHRGRPPTG